MDARDRAAGRAALFGQEFAAAALGTVLRQRDAWISALLRAVVHQAILADIKVAGAGAATPIILFAGGNVVLKLIHARERLLAERHDLFENFALARSQRLKLTVAVVNQAHCRRKSKLHGAV